MVMVPCGDKAMYEVHYSDGADHAGVGRFEVWHDAKRFADALRATGYVAFIVDLAQGVVSAKIDTHPRYKYN